VILTTPVIAALKANFPNARLTVLAGPKAHGLLSGSRMVDELVIYDKRATWMAKCRLIAKLRGVTFDAVVDLRNTLIPYLIRARRRSGIFWGKRPLSMQERHLSRLDFLGIRESPAQFDFFSEKDLESSKRKVAEHGSLPLAGWAALAPGAGSFLKRWRADGFREAARFMVSRGIPLMVVGGSEEKELADEVLRGVEGTVVNGCGLFAIRELAALLSRAALVLCNDSAIMHLAYELGRPVVAIFGPTDENKYGRDGRARRIVRLKLPCAPCQRSQCRFERQACFEDLSAKDVIHAVEEVIDAARN
jgi:heptosyltransferase-2